MPAGPGASIPEGGAEPSVPPAAPPPAVAPVAAPPATPAPPPATVPAAAPTVPDTGALAVPGANVRAGTPYLGGETVAAPVPVVTPAAAPQPVTAPAAPPQLSTVPASAAAEEGAQALAVPGVTVRAGTPYLGGETVTQPTPTVEAQAAPTAPTPGELDEVDRILAYLATYTPDLTDLEAFELLNPFSERGLAAYNPPLKGAGALASMRAHAAADHVDVLAALANALNEGAGGGIGDSGDAYGPFQIHATDGRIPSFSGQGPYSATVNAWAWSDNGIAYAFRSMAGAAHYPAAGLTGHNAVVAIVYGFERPANMKAAAATRIKTYDDLLRRGSAVWSYVSNQLAGPEGGGGSVNPPSSPGASSPAVPSSPIAAWQDFTSYLARDVPAAGAAVVANSYTLPDLVKSP